MNGIPFPEIDPVILPLWGPIALRWYNLAYILGFGVGYRGILWWMRKRQVLQEKYLDQSFHWVLVSILLGGRLGEFLFYPQNLENILYIWEGGMSFHGALVGLILGVYLFTKRYHQSFLAWLDHMALVAPVGLFLGRLANFVNGELIGRPTEMPWGVCFPLGGYIPRHPTQIYEAIFEGIVLWIILNSLAYTTNALKKEGYLCGLFLVGYGFFRFIIEFWKVPDAMVGPLTTGQLLCIPMVVFGLIFLYRVRK